MKYNGCIVIPAYNETLTIRGVVSDALKQSRTVIVVDDASSDNTAKLVQDFPVILIQHKQNKGKAQALLSGFAKAIELNMPYAITLDGDAQHSPENIPQLISAHIAHPNHLVIAARMVNLDRAPKARLIANKIADFWVSWAASTPIADSQSGFRLYPARLLQQLEKQHNNPSGFVFESEVLIEASHKDFGLAFVAIASCYPEQRRASHFRAGSDITQITIMVARKLLERGMNIPGLINFFVKKPIIYQPEDQHEKI